MGGMQFTWSQVAAWSAILLIQLGFIGYTRRHRVLPEESRVEINQMVTAVESALIH